MKGFVCMQSNHGYNFMFSNKEHVRGRQKYHLSNVCSSIDESTIRKFKFKFENYAFFLNKDIRQLIELKNYLESFFFQFHFRLINHASKLNLIESEGDEVFKVKISIRVF